MKKSLKLAFTILFLSANTWSQNNNDSLETLAVTFSQISPVSCTKTASLPKLTKRNNRSLRKYFKVLKGYTQLQSIILKLENKQKKIDRSQCNSECQKLSQTIQKHKKLLKKTRTNLRYYKEDREKLYVSSDIRVIKALHDEPGIVMIELNNGFQLKYDPVSSFVIEHSEQLESEKECLSELSTIANGRIIHLALPHSINNSLGEKPYITHKFTTPFYDFQSLPR